MIILRINQSFFGCLLVLITFSILSGTALPSGLNLEEINNLEYPVKTYQGMEKVRLQNGKFSRSGLNYLDIKIDNVVFGDLNNDGCDDAVIAYSYFTGPIQSIQSILCVVVDKNGQPEVTDFKHFNGRINSLEIKQGIIKSTLTIFRSKLNKDNEVKVISYSCQRGKLVEK